MHVQAYTIQRLVLAAPTILGVTIVIFAAVHFLPGDVIDQMLAEHGASSPEHRQALEEAYSLDKNIAAQYADWMGGVVQGDFGVSIISGRPVTHDLKQRLPATVELGILSITVGLLISIPVGVASAVWQNTLVDYLGRGLAVGLLAIPSFWLGLLILTYGFVWFDWTPPVRFQQIWDAPLTNVKFMIVPSIVLGAALAGTVMRLTRSAMLEVLRQDYMRTAFAKGLQKRTVINRHGLRNAFIPIVTVVGLQIPIVVGGTVIIETVFGIPGIGRHLLSSIETRDYPVVQTIVLLSSCVVILSNVLVDLAYPLIDPRVRLS